KLNTNTIAVVCNIALGVLAIVFGSRAGQPESEDTTSAAPETPTAAAAPIPADAVRLTVISFAITGFAGMATQIGWTRAISLGTGSSTYAFSLIVAVFILGLSLGGAWAARLAPKAADPVGLLAKILLLIGVLGLGISALLGIGPLLFFIL